VIPKLTERVNGDITSTEEINVAASPTIPELPSPSTESPLMPPEVQLKKQREVVSPNTTSTVKVPTAPSTNLEEADLKEVSTKAVDDNDTSIKAVDAKVADHNEANLKDVADKEAEADSVDRS
jgi:hypothetical protein